MHSSASLAVVHSHLTDGGRMGRISSDPDMTRAVGFSDVTPVTPGEYAPAACQERPFRRLDTMHVVRTRSWEAIPTLGTRKIDGELVEPAPPG